MEFRGAVLHSRKAECALGWHPTPEVRRGVIKPSGSVVVECDPTCIVQLLYVNNCT